MRPQDILRYAWGSLRGYPSRTVLMAIAMAIGVGAVIVLTGLGEGARLYVMNQFSSLGTNLVIVFPGRSDTAGVAGRLFMGQTPRDLTLDDALALTRGRSVHSVAPLAVGSALVSFGGRSREVPVIGSTAQWLQIRRMQIAQGSFLPPGDPRSATPVCVMGATVRAELFGNTAAVGQQVRIGDRRVRVIGVLASQGQHLGFNTDEIVIVPVAFAQSLFNTNTLLRILVEARSRDALDLVKEEVARTIQARHEGELDVTVVTQDAVLATFDRVLRALTLAVGGIAADQPGRGRHPHHERDADRGVAAHARDRLAQSCGGCARPDPHPVLCGSGGAFLHWRSRRTARRYGGECLDRAVLPAAARGPPVWAVAAALITAMLTGVLFSILPARRAAQLDPVIALSGR